MAALSGVSIAVHAHQALGLVGPNGAGKSTLLRVLCGLSHADAGRARLNGHDPIDDPLAARRQLGAFQSTRPCSICSRAANSCCGSAGSTALPEPTLVARIDELAEALDLAEALPRRIGGYSKGMRQKLAFAAALLHDPTMLILDEPFEGVDVVAVEAMKAIIRQFVDHGAAVLLSSHILGLVEDVCTQVRRHGRRTNWCSRATVSDWRSRRASWPAAPVASSNRCSWIASPPTGSPAG